MIGSPLERIPLRWRRPAIYGGYLAFAGTIALTTLYATLPRDRIKDVLEAALSEEPAPDLPLAMGLDVSIGDLGLTLLSGTGLKMKDMILRSRPVNAGEKPARYVIDDMTVHVGIFGLMRNRPTYHIVAHALSGEIDGTMAYTEDSARYKFSVKDLSLSGVPGLEVAGLPVAGTLGLDFDIAEPKMLLAQSSGAFKLALEGAVLGDGKAKLTVPGDPFLGQGLTFPKLRLGHVAGNLAIEKGRGTFDNLVAHSADADATVDGYVELQDPLPSSRMHAFVKFRPSEALANREPTVKLINDMLQTAKRSDGFLGIQLTGSFGAPYALPNREPPAGVKTSGPSGGPSSSGSSSAPSSPPIRPTSGAVTGPPMPPSGGAPALPAGPGPPFGSGAMPRSFPSGPPSPGPTAGAAPEREREGSATDRDTSIGGSVPGPGRVHGEPVPSEGANAPGAPVAPGTPVGE